MFVPIPPLFGVKLFALMSLAIPSTLWVSDGTAMCQGYRIRVGPRCGGLWALKTMSGIAHGCVLGSSLDSKNHPEEPLSLVALPRRHRLKCSVASVSMCSGGSQSDCQWCMGTCLLQ